VARSTVTTAGFRQSGRRTLVELGIVVVALGLLVLAGRSGAGWLADAAVQGLPASVDRAVGEAGAAQMRAKYGPAAQAPLAARERVARIFDELRGALTQEQLGALVAPQVTVVADDQVNAFALPGGEVFVLTGLLERVGDDDSMLRGVLAHELGHAVRRHGLRSLARSAATSVAIGWLLGNVDEMGRTLVAGASELEGLSYSRVMETEADQFAVELLTRAGRDPAGLARFLESLEQVPVPELLSTHPDPRARAEAIRAEL
jgi:predicted Zn-dependent protease